MASKRHERDKKPRTVKVHGMDQIIQRYRDVEIASGRTPEQTRAKHLMDKILGQAAAGRVVELLPPPLIRPGPWRGKKSGHLWEMWLEAERAREWLAKQLHNVSKQEELAELFALMFFGLASLMLIRFTPRHTTSCG